MTATTHDTGGDQEDHEDHVSWKIPAIIVSAIAVAAIVIFASVMKSDDSNTANNSQSIQPATAPREMQEGLPVDRTSCAKLARIDVDHTGTDCQMTPGTMYFVGIDTSNAVTGDTACTSPQGKRPWRFTKYINGTTGLTDNFDPDHPPGNVTGYYFSPKYPLHFSGNLASKCLGEN